MAAPTRLESITAIASTALIRRRIRRQPVMRIVPSLSDILRRDDLVLTIFCPKHCANIAKQPDLRQAALGFETWKQESVGASRSNLA